MIDGTRMKYAISPHKQPMDSFFYLKKKVRKGGKGLPVPLLCLRSRKDVLKGAGKQPLTRLGPITIN